MKKVDLLIAHNKGIYNISVEGRANFEYGLPLRNFAKNLEAGFEKVVINLESCTGMDSTFMGILAMIGLKAKKARAIVEILNADSSNRHLLKGLGLEKLFNFVECKEKVNKTSCSYSDTEPLKSPKSCEDRMLKTAKTVCEAHKTLVDVDDSNGVKFEKVIELADADVQRLENKTPLDE